ALEFVRGNRYVALANGALDYAYDDAEEAESYTLSAHLIGSAINGYVTVSTPTRISTLAGAGCPAEGVARSDGDGYAEIRYGTSTGTADAGVIEINGSLAKASTCAEVHPILGAEQSGHRLVPAVAPF